MSYTQAEVELLKECLKEICDDHFFSNIHELRKKLAASNAKQQDLETKVKRYEQDIEKLKACHSCHGLMKTFSDACTQTTKPCSPRAASPEPIPDIPPEPAPKENGHTSENHMQVDDSPPKQAEPAVPKNEFQPKPSTSKAIPPDQEVICISDSDDDI